MSDYKSKYTGTEIDTLLGKVNDKQDKLIAGNGITIAEDGKTISSTGEGSGGSSVTLINNLNTNTPGVGALDAYQGNIINRMIIAIKQIIDTINDSFVEKITNDDIDEIFEDKPYYYNNLPNCGDFDEL